MLPKTTFFDSIADISPFVRRVGIKNVTGISGEFIDMDNLFVYLSRGEASYTVHGVTFAMQKGSALLVPPVVPHILQPNPGSSPIEHIMLFDLYYNKQRSKWNYERNRPVKYPQPSAPEKKLDKLVQIVHFGNADQAFIERSFLQMVKESEERAPGWQLLLKSLCIGILSCFLRAALDVSANSGKIVRGWDKVEKVIRIIHQRYADSELSVRTISQEACISESYLFQLFSKACGITIHRYINQVRIDRAKALIAGSGKNFTRVADLTGFPDIHSFSRVFKRVTGVTPSDFVRFYGGGFERFNGSSKQV